MLVKTDPVFAKYLAIQGYDDELKDLEDEQRKLATSENQKADKEEGSAKEHEEKGSEETKKFEDWCQLLVDVQMSVYGKVALSLGLFNWRITPTGGVEWI